MTLPGDRRHRILVVDNEPIHIAVLGELLRPEHDVLAATTGERALESAAANNPDLILLDIVMGGIDGYEVCRRLKEDPKTQPIPVIFLTAKDAVDDEARGFELGAVDYITKPFSSAIVRARVRTQLELKRQRDELVELTEVKNRFLAIAAHDLRSPLSSTVMTLQWFLDQAGESVPAKYADALRRVMTACRQMLGLLEGLLDVKRIERGSFEMKLEQTSLAEVVRERISLLRPLVEVKQLRVDTELEDVPPFELDAERVGQAFDNLLTNAIKYSPLGRAIRVRLTRREDWARVDVQDEGPGISSEEMARAFGEFQTLGSKPTDGASSTGLGLYIVKRVIEAHGGRVHIESALEQGTTLSFELPMRRGENASA